MGGHGVPPKPESRTRHKPVRGTWQATPGVGWQHGPIPRPPDGLTAPSLAAWKLWMESWIGSHWSDLDLPGLRITVQLYDQCERYFAEPYTERETARGDVIHVLKPNPSGELRQMMDNYGITPKGQQDRRWLAPKPDEQAVSKAVTPGGRYGSLSVVNE